MVATMMATSLASSGRLTHSSAKLGFVRRAEVKSGDAIDAPADLLSLRQAAVAISPENGIRWQVQQVDARPLQLRLYEGHDADFPWMAPMSLESISADSA